MKKLVVLLLAFALLCTMAMMVRAENNIYNDDELDWSEVADIDPEDVKSVSIRTLPDKVVYAYGEPLDITGLTLLVVYGEDERLVLFSSFEVSGYNAETAGVQTITVTVLGKSVTFTVTVEAKEEPPVAKNGWVKENGKWAYYVNDVKSVNVWKKDSKGWCYLGADGYMLTDKWIKDSVGWCYVGDNGYCVTEKWVKDSKGWVYLDKNGRMVYDQWLHDGVGWAYVNKDGYSVTNKWMKDSKGWCYLGQNGYMVTEKWVKDSKGWCYIGQNGYMVTEKWVKDSKGWCYVGDNGYCKTNAWVKDSKGWCYLDKNGRMVYDTWVGKYYVNANGYWVE